MVKHAFWAFKTFWADNVHTSPSYWVLFLQCLFIDCYIYTKARSLLTCAMEMSIRVISLLGRYRDVRPLYLYWLEHRCSTYSFVGIKVVPFYLGHDDRPVYSPLKLLFGKTRLIFDACCLKGHTIIHSFNCLRLTSEERLNI